MFGFTKKEPKEKRKADNVPSDFKINEVYKMDAGYHTKKPYYILIEDIGEDFIQTTIPDKHSFKIMQSSYEWKYHIPRMMYMGTIHNDELKKLVYNQHHLPYKK